jgi:hypothetical protein
VWEFYCLSCGGRVVPDPADDRVPDFEHAVDVLTEEELHG